MKSKILNNVDFEKANILLEAFNKSTGFVTAILDLDGNILSKSGWRQICTDFHRINPKTASNCIVSDTELAGKMGEGERYHFYKCMNGLIDVAVPIIINGAHIANLFSGQFFFEAPDISFFKKQAKLYGFEEKSYLETLGKVPVVSKEKVEDAMNFLLYITQLIIEMTAERLEQIELNEAIKKSETALCESQVQLQQSVSDLMESHRIAHLGTWELDLTTNQVIWSEEIYRMYGVDSTVPPPSYSEHAKLFPAESWDKLSDAIQQTMASGVPYEVELETLTMDGAKGWVWIRGEAKKDSNNNITSLRGVAQDITEHKMTVQALAHSHDLMRYIIEHNRSAVAVHDRDLKYLYVSQRYMDDYNIKEKNIIGKHHYDVLPDLPQKWRDVHQKALRGEILSSEKDLYIRDDGTTVWTRWECRPWYEADGSIGGIIIYTEVITEQVKLLEKLIYLSYHDHLTGLYNRRSFEEELKRFDTKENFPISIIMCDINGLKLINDSFGHDSGDVVLKEAAEAIKKVCRKGDIIARIGGDEFVLLLSKISAHESGKIAQRIKDLASKEKVNNIELSISCGYDTKTTAGQSIVEVIANAENHMYQNKLYERSSIRSRTVDLIMDALFEKSKREAEHSNRVSSLCQAIASEMHFSKDAVNQMKIAGLIHDIGKIGIDEKILNKQGSLTADERRYIEKHPETGWRLLSSTNEFSALAQFVLDHHERWDGSGYPNGKKGQEIQLEARIISVADAYDAMTSQRSYRKERSKGDAVNELKRCSGTQFDPNIVDVFVNQVLVDDRDFSGENQPPIS